MKKLLIAILLFTGLASKGQTDTKVYGHWIYQYLKVDSSYRGPQDTIASAPVGATAVKGNTLYVKLSTGYWSAITGAGGSGVWGSIAGTLSAQTDLAAKFGTKYDTTVRLLDTLYAITDSTLGYYINGQFRSFKIRGAVQNFNGRIGAIVLTLSDVTTALGYTPSDLPNVANSLQVINNGNTTSWQTGLYSARPAAGNFGSYYTATDSLAIYFDNGISWITISRPASVPSVFGRSGAVVAQTGDYTPAQIGLANVLNSLQIVNTLGTPSASSDVFANRPAAGTVGRLFVSTDTKEIYRDNGTSWDKVGSGASGGVTTYAALTDVNLTSLINGQIAQYNSGSGKWVNITPTSSLVGLGSVPNVDATNATNIASGILPAARIGTSSIDLTTKVTGLLPDANIASAANWNAKVSDSGLAVLFAPLSGVPLAKTTPSGTQRFILYDTSLYNLGAIATRGSVNKVRDSLGVLISGKQATGNYITALTSDVSASGPGPATATVKGIQGIAVSATPPTTNQVLQYNGSQYAPITLTLADSGISVISAVLAGVPMAISHIIPRFIKWDTTEGNNPAAIVTQAGLQKRVDSLLAIINAATSITVNRGLHPVGSNRFVIGDVAIGATEDSSAYFDIGNPTSGNSWTWDSVGTGFKVKGLPAGTGTPTVIVHMPDSSLAQMPYPSGGGSSPPFSDASNLVKNASDPTKLIGITAANQTTGTTTVDSLPGNTPTMLAGLNYANVFQVAQTLNFGGSFGGDWVPLANGASRLGNGTDNLLSVNTHQIISNGSQSYTVGTGSNYTYHVNTTTVDSILPSGQWIWNKYGLGTFTGTPAYYVAVTSAGAVIETSGTGSGIPSFQYSGGGTQTGAITVALANATSNSTMAWSNSGGTFTLNFPTQYNYGVNTLSPNTYWGPNTGNSIHSGTGENVGFGQNVMPALNSYANWNTGIGMDVLQIADSAYQNTCGGALACALMWRTHYNAAWGDGALSGDSTGHDNSAFGHVAWDFLKGGSYGTAMGSAAGQVEVSGSYNTVAGAYSMSQSSGNNHNSIFGAYNYQSNIVPSQWLVSFGDNNFNVYAQPCDSCIAIGNNISQGSNIPVVNTTVIANGGLTSRSNEVILGGKGGTFWEQVINLNNGGLTTSQRNAAVSSAYRAADFNYNPDSLRPEFYNGSIWQKVAVLSDITGGGYTFPYSVINSSGVQLSGDVASPGNSYYYGTNSGGTKGWYTLPSGSTPINNVTAATAANGGVNHANYEQEWDWNSLAGGPGLYLHATTTASTAGSTLLSMERDGTSGTTGLTTYLLHAANSQNGGASSINVGALFDASAASTDYPAMFRGGGIIINSSTSATPPATSNGSIDVEFTDPSIYLNASATSGYAYEQMAANGTTIGYHYALGTTYGASGVFRAGGMLDYAGGAGGFTIDAHFANADIYFAQNDVNAMIIDSIRRIHFDTATGKSLVNIGGTYTLGNPGNHGFGLSADWMTFTDNTAASGTAPVLAMNSFMGGAFNETHTAVVATVATTVLVDSFPTAGTNLTITDNPSLYVRTGKERADGGVEWNNIPTGPTSGTFIAHKTDSTMGQVTYASGTYTPTVTTVTNCSSPSAGTGHYIRIGNQVTVDVPVVVVTTVGGSQTEFYVSLPIASTISAGSDLTGQGQIQGPYTLGPGITGNTTSHVADVTYTQTASASGPNMYLHFTYTVD